MDDIENLFYFLDNDILYDVFLDDFENILNFEYFDSNLMIQIFLILMFGFLVMFIFVCNIIVCYVVGKNKKMQMVINVFIVNMFVLDLILVFLNVLFNIVRYLVCEWILGDFCCYMLNFLLMLLVYVLIFILIVIVLDRYQVFFYFLQFRIIKCISYVIIFVIWFVLIFLVLLYGVFIKVVVIDFLLVKFK